MPILGSYVQAPVAETLGINHLSFIQTQINYLVCLCHQRLGFGLCGVYTTVGNQPLERKF